MIIELRKDDKDTINMLYEKFSTFFLSKKEIEDDFEFNIFSKYFIYVEKSNIIGFINYYDLYERFEIANFAVLENERNKGIGTLLLKHVIKLGYEKKISNITLEVKNDNNAAICLYEKFKFKKVAIRKKYYNGIDGILMERKMI